MGLVVRLHHRPAAGDHRLSFKFDIGIVGQRFGIKCNGVFAIGRQRRHHRIASPVGMHIAAVLNRHLSSARRTHDGKAFADGLPERHAMRMGDNGARCAPGKLLTGAIVAIAELRGSVPAVVIQCGAAVTALAAVNVALLEGVVEIGMMWKRTEQRRLLRSTSAIVGGRAVADRALG